MSAIVWRFVSPDGRTCNALVLIGLVILIVCGTVHVLTDPAAADVARFVGALGVLCFLAAARFSLRLVRVALFASIVIVLLGVVDVGRDATVRAQAAIAAETATSLRTRLDALTDDTGTATTTTASAGEAGKALAKLESVLSLAPPSAETDILRALAADLRALLDRRSAETAELAEQRNRLTAVNEESLRAAAAAAVDAVAAALEAQVAAVTTPSRSAADTAIKALCVGAGGNFDRRDGHPGPLCVQPGDAKAALLETLTATARLEVTRFEHARATGKAKQSLATDVDARIAALAKAAGRRSHGVAAAESVDILRAGASQVVGAVPGLDAVGREHDEEPHVEVGVVGWVVIAAIALLWYRGIERRAAAKALGPVVVKAHAAKPEEAGAYEAGAYEDLFRTYVLRNIPDPGAVPGAAALRPVTDLLGATSVPAVTAIGKAISAAIAVLEQKHGYTVTFRVISGTVGATADKATPKPVTTAGVAPVPAPAAKATPPPVTTIAVRVTRTRTEALIDQRLVHHDDAMEAVRAAAYWAAAVALGRSDRVPPWTRWPTATSDALAAYYGPDDKRDEPPLEKMIEAVSRAPSNGMLCLKLSHAYALAGRHLDAFELALRAATVNGHYVAARYRLAITANLVASDIAANWRARPQQQRDRVCAALHRYAPKKKEKKRQQPRGEQLANGLGRDEPAQALCRFAVAELEDIHLLLNPFWVCFSALRRSERSYWLGFLRRGEDSISARRHFMRAATSARSAIERRRGDRTATSSCAHLLEDKRTFWQVAYNVACADAIDAGAGDVQAAERALGRLESALERPGSHQLTREWVEADPDLKPLGGLPRFRAFASALHSTRKSDAD